MGRLAAAALAHRGAGGRKCRGGPVMDLSSFLDLIDSTIRLSTPLLFAALAGLYSERSGIFDISLEGKMLIAAFASASAAAVWGSVMLGLCVGILAAVGFSLVHGVASITYRGNQIVSGVAINFIAAGLTIILGQSWFGQGGRTPPLVGNARFTTIELPFASQVADVPILGSMYANLLSG